MKVLIGVYTSYVSGILPPVSLGSRVSRRPFYTPTSPGSTTRDSDVPRLLLWSADDPVSSLPLRPSEDLRCPPRTRSVTPPRTERRTCPFPTPRAYGVSRPRAVGPQELCRESPRSLRKVPDPERVRTAKDHLPWFRVVSGQVPTSSVVEVV